MFIKSQGLINSEQDLDLKWAFHSVGQRKNITLFTVVAIKGNYSFDQENELFSYKHAHT